MLTIKRILIEQHNQGDNVENLFDEKYEYAPGYIMPGISGQLGFSASF